MTRNDLRNAGACVAVVAAAVLLVWPFAEMPYADDWAYSHIALHLARTGHLIYNGWESALLVLHSCWGAFLIRLFGFSFTVLRLSTLPFALGAVALCYVLARRASLAAPAAILVTFLLGLSPVFLPLAASFMTDVPCLFFILFSLYALVRAAEASADPHVTPRAWIWLTLGVVSGLVGGTGRQVVWLVPLVVLPYWAWIRRRRPWFACASLASWILVLAATLAMTAWFNRQPYVIPQPPITSELKLAWRAPLWELNISARTALMILLLALPAALPAVLSALVVAWQGRGSRRMAVSALFLALLSVLLIHPNLASIPWVASTLNWEGINGASELAGRPVVLTKPIRAFFAVGVYAAAVLLASKLWDLRSLSRRLARFFFDPPPGRLAMAAMSLFSVAYLALLIVRAAHIDIFDRYFLPLIPWLAIVLLAWNNADERTAWTLRRTMPSAWLLLAIYALYAVASTQDVLALARARAAAAARLEAADVPRTAIDAGFSYNGWTELLVSGRVNSRWVVNPPGAYRPELGQTPSVKPLYRLEYQPTPETMTTPFGSVPYFSLLPPFRKQVYIDRIIKP